jgi:cytochrome b subunit of formate dehydrogenase
MTMQSASETIYRHTRIVRIAHWINALCFLLLLMSGLQIFNAHPRLYWGQFGADGQKIIIPESSSGAGPLLHLHGQAWRDS